MAPPAPPAPEFKIFPIPRCPPRPPPPPDVSLGPLHHPSLSALGHNLSPLPLPHCKIGPAYDLSLLPQSHQRQGAKDLEGAEKPPELPKVAPTAPPPPELKTSSIPRCPPRPPPPPNVFQGPLHHPPLSALAHNLSSPPLPHSKIGPAHDLSIIDAALFQGPMGLTVLDVNHDNPNTLGNRSLGRLTIPSHHHLESFSSGTLDLRSIHSDIFRKLVSEISLPPSQLLNARSLHDPGADLTVVDEGLATSLALLPHPTSRSSSVTTTHGTPGTASEPTLTLRMRGTLKAPPLPPQTPFPLPPAPDKARPRRTKKALKPPPPPPTKELQATMDSLLKVSMMSMIMLTMTTTMAMMMMMMMMISLTLSPPTANLVPKPGHLHGAQSPPAPTIHHTQPCPAAHLNLANLVALNNRINSFQRSHPIEKLHQIYLSTNKLLNAIQRLESPQPAKDPRPAGHLDMAEVNTTPDIGHPDFDSVTHAEDGGARPRLGPQS